MRRADRTQVEKGRGAVTNPAGRVEGTRLEATADGWGSLDEPPRRVETVLAADVPRHAITRNKSPDLPFDQSVNPYQGCEHGCIYCFARLLDRELSAPGYVCKPINLGANTDPYQPAEREHRTTRELLEVLLVHRHPVTIVTKGALVLRDLDLLADLAPRPGRGLRQHHHARRRAEACARAAFMLLRLPHELGQLFEQWLREHYQSRAERVLNLLRDARGGRLNDPRFGHQMRGEGAYARILAARFQAASRRLSLDQQRGVELDTSQFLRDPQAPLQGSLFS